MSRLYLASLLIFTLAVGAVFALTRQTAHAATITVDTLADTVAADGDCTLREAILNAEDAADGQPHTDCDAGNPSGEDTIVFSVSGTITLAALSFPGGGAALTQDLTIDGGGEITIDAHDASRFFFIDSTELTLIGLRFENGLQLVQDAGAIRVDGGTLNIVDSEFVENGSAGSGGAIFAMGAEVNISGSTFTNNLAGEDGGAVCAIANSTVTVTDSTFAENGAEGDA